MDFEHFTTLVRGTLQVDLADAGLVLRSTDRADAGEWIVEVSGPRGVVRESVRSGIAHGDAMAFTARLLERIREHAI